MEECKYCSERYQNSDRIVLQNEYFFANFDNHPVSPGHMKIISKKHRNSFDELTDKEIISYRDILTEAKKLIIDKYKPDGWNIGNNEGEAAGQTVFHLHIHLIPRYEGDVGNPVGGVRSIIPGKGDYIKK